MDLSRTDIGERIAAGGGLALFLVMFLDWYGVRVSGRFAGFRVSEAVGGGSAWQVFSAIDLVLLVVAVAAVAQAVLHATGRMPALPFPPALVVLALATLATLLILYRILDAPAGPASVPGVEADVTRQLGIFLALFAATATAYGAWTTLSERRYAPNPAPPPAPAQGGDANGDRRQVRPVSGPEPQPFDREG